jgi:hypothetical protein
MNKQLTGLMAAIGASTCLLTSFQAEPVNQLTPQEKKDGWTLLFDGKTTNGWHLYNKGQLKSAWTVKEGALYCNPADDKVEHGDLVSDKEFKNYDLKFEWKITQGGNSGVFFNVQEKKDIPVAWASGPEYQLLENSHPDYKVSNKKWAGTLYGFYPPKNAVEPKPAGQWNQSEIKQVNGKVKFYLNGVLTAQADLASQAWKDMVAASNFKTFPEFGKHTQGRLALQDWSKGISFRNLKLKEL